MITGHIYRIDLARTHPSYVAALQEFLNTFGRRHDGSWARFAVQTTSDMILGLAVNDERLDHDLISLFFKRCDVVEVRISKHETRLSFPQEPFVMKHDKTIPGEAPKMVDETVLADLVKDIDVAKGRS